MFGEVVQGGGSRPHDGHRALRYDRRPRSLPRLQTLDARNRLRRRGTNLKPRGTFALLSPHFKLLEAFVERIH
jgi:hypothetical protein